MTLGHLCSFLIVHFSKINNPSLFCKKYFFFQTGLQENQLILIFIKNHFDFLWENEDHFLLNWFRNDFCPIFTGKKWFRLIFLSKLLLFAFYFLIFLQKWYNLTPKNDFDFDFLFKTEMIFWFFGKSKNHFQNDFDFWMILP